MSDAKATSGKSDVTFSFAGKNYSVRAEENDDAVAIAKKLAQAIKADPIEDEAAGKFTVTDKGDGTIEIEAASDKAVKSDKIKATAVSVKSSGVLTLSLHVGADSTSDNQISVDIKQMSADVLGLKTGKSSTTAAENDTLLVNGKDDEHARAAIDTIASALQ